MQRHLGIPAVCTSQRLPLHFQTVCCLPRRRDTVAVRPYLLRCAVRIPPNSHWAMAGAYHSSVPTILADHRCRCNTVLTLDKAALCLYREWSAHGNTPTFPMWRASNPLRIATNMVLGCTRARALNCCFSACHLERDHQCRSTLHSGYDEILTSRPPSNENPLFWPHPQLLPEQLTIYGINRYAFYLGC